MSITPSDPVSGPLADAPPVVAGEVLPALAVVVPVRNEAENIDTLIGEIAAALTGGPAFEIVYVDDGSTDATPERLAEARARFPMLRILRHATACGQSQAIATGVRAARAPWIATLDGDGQNDPADIPALLSRRDSLGEGAEAVLLAGHRVNRKDTWVKRRTSRIANAVRRWALKDGTPDTGCGLKLFARDAFLDLPRFDHMHRFLPALFIRRGGSVISVPVNHRPRQAGRSKYGTLDRLMVGITDLLGVMWLTRRSSRPVVTDVTGGGEAR